MAKKILVILCCFVIIAFHYYASAEEAADTAGGATTANTEESMPGAAENIKVFLNNLEDAVTKMDTYRFVMLSENWKGEKHEKKTIRFQFKKPNLMRADVIDGDKKGSVVLLNKKGEIRGKNSLGLRKTLKPSDSRLKNIRGFTFMNSSLSDKTKRFKEHILERGCAAVLNEEIYDGKPAYRLHIKHKDSDDAVTDEDAWFEKETHLILKNLKYENDVKVTDTAWKNYEINIYLDDGLFEQ